MNLLVTGGAGFIGSNLIRMLIHKPEVSHLVNLDSLTYAGRIENLKGIENDDRYTFERVDLRDQPAVVQLVAHHRITHVIHLAAESHVDRSIAAPADFIHTNIVGTFHLIEACRQLWAQHPETLGQRRFVHVSTDEVFGALGPTGTFTEESNYAPNSPYAASKASSDLLVRAAHHTYGIPAVITNCSNNYGPFQHPEKLIPTIIRHVAQRQSVPIYGDGSNIRDWLHVADHCTALWQVLLGGKVGESYCIGGNNEWTNLQLAQRICDIIDELNPLLGGHSRNLLTLVEDRPGHDFRYAIDSSKISRDLGWKASHDSASGLFETVAWYLDHTAGINKCLPSEQPRKTFSPLI